MFHYLLPSLKQVHNSVLQELYIFLDDEQVKVDFTSFQSIVLQENFVGIEISNNAKKRDQVSTAAVVRQHLDQAVSFSLACQ